MFGGTKVSVGDSKKRASREIGKLAHRDHTSRFISLGGES